MASFRSYGEFLTLKYFTAFTVATCSILKAFLK